MAKKHHHPKKNRKHGLSPGSLIYTGNRAQTPSSTLLVWYNEANYQASDTYSIDRQEGMTWVDVRGLTETTLIERIGLDFQIHPLAMEDVLNTGQRAKLEEYDNGLFFIVPNLKLKPDTVELEHEQIALFAGKHFVVSFQEDPDDTLEPVRNRIKEGLGQLRKKDSDYLLYALVDSVVDNYFLILDSMESNVLELEETLHLKGAQDSIKAKMFQLKRIVNELKHRILPLREAVNRFHRAESEIIDNSNRLYVRDLMDHVARILEGIDNQRDMLSNLEALYHAEAANRMNIVMRLLTVISTIFIPLSFIAGVYGMNFDNMPELHSQNGYFILIGVMIFLMLGMLSFFRARKWL